MKIWFPTIRASSGADVYTERLASTLVKYGIDAEITWFPPIYEFLPELMRHHTIPEEVDIIHANSWNASVFLGLGLPVVATVLHIVHDPAFRPYRSMLQAAYHALNVYSRESRAIKSCNGIVSISGYTESIVKKLFQRNSDVIELWVDLKKYRPSVLAKRNNKFTVLIVGNSGLRKGSDLLPSLALKLGLDFEIRVTGGLKNCEVNNSHGSNVVMLGRLTEENLIVEYQRCDAVLSLSRYEGFGYTALEAMACAKPFLGFNTSGLADVVVNNETGVLCAIDDIDALANNCRTLMLDLETRAAYGANGLDRATKIFSEEHLIGMYIDLYSKIVSSAG